MKNSYAARTHCVIPDLQIKPGVNTDHLTWIGNYLAEKQPDVVVQIGDVGDMESLNYHAKKIELEGKRYLQDVKAVRNGMAKLFAPLRKVKSYKPRLVLTLGNHEERINRVVFDNPHLEGVVSLDDLALKQYGWETHKFLKPVNIDGINYAHYFVSGAYGRPVSSASALLRRVQGSAVMGHTQDTDVAFHKYTQHFALFSGICYLHDEDYLTPQGNATRRQIVFLHEVHDGIADLMFVSLDFLKRKYS